MLKKSTITILISFMLALVGCSKNPKNEPRPDYTITSISISPKNVALVAGETKQLSVSVLPECPDGRYYCWSTSNSYVVNVSNNGLITANNEGSATISVDCDGAKAECQVSVSKRIVPVVSVELNESTVELKVGGVITLVASVFPINATEQNVEWESSDNSVAQVDGGNVVALSPGRANIIASAGGKTATCEINVVKGTISVESIVLDKLSLEICEGENAELRATVYPDEATDKTIVWSTLNADVATVSGGIVSAVKEGTTTIVASAGECTAECAVTVKSATIPVESVSLSLSSLTLEEGKTETLIATVFPENATDKTVTWSSSMIDVATVNDGVVTALAAGEATITATSGSASATCTVSVTPKQVLVSSIVLSSSKILCLYGGETKTLTANIYPQDATNKSVTWVSSDSSIATVENGTIIPIASGTIDVYATATDGSNVNSNTCVVSVIKEPEGSVFLGTYTSDGNPLFWAKCNLGAEKPEDYGDYFAWGEVVPKNLNDPESYRNYIFYTDPVHKKYSKYVDNENFGDVDNKTSLEPEDDAAHIILGGTWRMPTKAEMIDLVRNCKVDWETVNGVPGCLFTCKTEGLGNNTLFFPKAGRVDYDGLETEYVRTDGFYWTSTLMKTYNEWGYAMKIFGNVPDSNYSNQRDNGLSIRPVCQ